MAQDAVEWLERTAPGDLFMVEMRDMLLGARIH